MDVIQVAVLGTAGMLLGIVLKESRPEYAAYISLGCGICILIAASSKIAYLLESIRTVQDSISVDVSYLSILLKMIGMTYVGHFSSSLCKDAGYSALAMQIETFCKL